ncbi:gliding motility lipoprotein GldD [Putridiphycobacter roseus]|uniref:Gliding motility lipoprotein GldD n=2 Tax=Putridiphycobacter roseus TaxID=2219161 RepID=A0A2W1MZ63_9FLAO|nr:gliding motility lipoprotein GldD [Putridiphycobacter roseus]
MTIIFIGCDTEDITYPKPLSGMKISFQEKDFSNQIQGCNFEFLSPTYAVIDSATQGCNLNINYIPFDATLFLTYIPVDTGGLMNHLEYSRKLVYEHSIQADGIEEKTIVNPAHHVYGTAYKLIGNSASNYQFYLTDSLNHFLRGALYFNAKPNYDSLKPSIDYLMVDFDTLFNSLEWSTITEE